MSNACLVFHRPALAQRLAAQILAVSAGSAARSGVFLAAPRRTGKSTFIREDLRPAFEAHDAIVAYVDLWANLQADPGEVIVQAIRSTMALTDGVLLRLARKAGVRRFTAGALQFDVDRIGLGQDVSLTDALSALSDETQRVIVLIIDEAQHAITTEAGVASLFALKAARDELNSSQHHGLRVVCTGSNRDKLAMLRNSKDQAFFCAPMVDFPLLGRPYTDWFCAQADLPFKLDPEAVWPLFTRTGHRPELLVSAADLVRFDFALDPADGPDRFAAMVGELTEEMNAAQQRVIRGLTPIQLAVLRVMAACAAPATPTTPATLAMPATPATHYAPFEAATMDKYRTAMRLAGRPPDQVKVDVPGVQQALIALQDKKLVWRAARGVYAVEEQGVIDYLLAAGLLEGLA